MDLADGAGRRDSLADAVARAAEVALTRWAERLGQAGLAAARALPGLLAAIDQHAAEVRDALADRDGQVARTSLAAYADGVSDTATQHGWDSSAPSGSDWSRASWPVVRLLAVCQLADAPSVARESR